MLRALMIALVGSLVAAALMGPPQAVAALEGKPVPATAARSSADLAEQADAPKLILAPQEPVLQPGANDYVFTVLLRNPGEAPVPKGTLQIRLDAARIDGAAGLTARASGEARLSGVLLTELPIPETRAGEEQTLSVVVPRAQMPLGFGSDPGVYGVVAEVRATEEAEETVGSVADSAGGPQDPLPEVLVSGSSTIVWRTARWSARLPLTVVVPFVLPGEVAGMPTQTELAEAVPRLTALLDASERWNATLAIDPRIIAGIRAYGDAAPAPARDLLERFSSTSLQVFLLQFADADPAAQASLGYTELLRPKGLAYVTNQGTFPVTGADEATGGETGGDAGPAPDANPIPPGLDELLDWPTAQAAAWPAPGAVDAKTLRLLDRSGIDSVVLRSDNVIGSVTAQARVGSLDALISDAGLDAAAAGALSGESESERAASRAELASRLALGAEAKSPGMALALDRGAVADAETPSAIFDALDQLGWLTPTAAVGGSENRARLNPGSTTKDRRDLLTENVKRAERVDALAPLLERPWYLTEYQRVRLLGVFATRYSEPGVDLTELAKKLSEHDATVLEGVRAVPSESTQLIGASSRVPVLVHNALPFDALITLRVAPTSAAVVVPERRFEEQRIAPGGNSTVLVPVDSRVSSGDATLTVKVADSVDDSVFSEAALRLTIRSSYEAIMLIVLGAMAALLLGFGVWRSVRRHRPDSADSATA